MLSEISLVFGLDLGQIWALSPKIDIQNCFIDQEKEHKKICIPLIHISF